MKKCNKKILVLVCGFGLHIGLAATAARPICAQNHRLAMYQKAVTMFYLRMVIT